MLQQADRPRRRRTSPAVRRIDRLARLFITAGGIGTIAAVTLIMVFLVAVVVPLFGSASAGDPVAARDPLGRPILAGVDELQLLGWALAVDGRVRTYRADTGERLAETIAFEGELTGWTRLPGGELLLGFGDGTVRTARVGFASVFLERDEVPAELRGLARGEWAPFRDGMVIVTPEGQFRLQRLALTLGQPFDAAGSAVVAVDRTETSTGAVWAVLDAGGGLHGYLEEDRLNMMTGERETRRSGFAIPYTPDAARGVPMFVGLAGTGTSLFLLWDDGALIRYDTRNKDAVVAAERRRVVAEGARVTAAAFVLGKGTLVVGDSNGEARGWFLTKPRDAGTLDGSLLADAHVYAGPQSPVTALAPSRRSRLIAAGYGDGSLRLFQATLGDLVLELDAGIGTLHAIQIAPKEDGLVAASSDAVVRWPCSLAYPRASVAALFRPVWYEGYPEPEHVWQSTGGSDDFEPKFGLVPLIIGTLKATFYSMLIAVPVGLLAAIFTTEFLSPRVRSGTKSLIEMMASLPSVVLGFIAALILAPYLQHFVPAVVTCFVTVPVALLLGARLWQFLPQRLAVRLAGWPRLAAVAAFLALGLWAGTALGPAFERAYFDGDLKQWLAGYGEADGRGGWIILLFPLSAFGVAALYTLFGASFVRRLSAGWSARACAAFDLGKYLVLVALTLGLAWLLAGAFTASGWDPRGGFLGSYVPRNALVVGFLMGFAVVPLIYTLSEDALSSVPRELREASLGAGATEWQTAWRIVIPTAMSGLFGALMIGLGRAVGETMIVLMAAGNTPIMDWNMFSGFRTLSANIAVELPEAPAGGVHYRVLFLAALVLFAMTFVINTAAEGVRRVVRRRHAQL